MTADALRQDANRPAAPHQSTLVAIHGVGDAALGEMSSHLAQILSSSPGKTMLVKREDWLIGGDSYPRLSTTDANLGSETVEEIIEVNWAQVLRPSGSGWSLVQHIFLTSLGMLALSCEPMENSNLRPVVARLHRLLVGCVYLWLAALPVMIMLLASCGSGHLALRIAIVAAFLCGIAFCAHWLGGYWSGFYAGYLWLPVFAAVGICYLLPHSAQYSQQLVAASASAFGVGQQVIGLTLLFAFVEVFVIASGATWTQQFTRAGFLWFPFLVYSIGSVVLLAGALALAKSQLDPAAYADWEEAYTSNLGYDLWASEVAQMGAILILGVGFPILAVIVYFVPRPYRAMLGLNAPGKTSQDILALLLWSAPFVLMLASGVFWYSSFTGWRTTGVDALDIYALSALRAGALVPLLFPTARIILDIAGDVVFHLQPDKSRLGIRRVTLPRLTALLKHLRASRPGNRIVVFAHSQGSKIAYDVLHDECRLADVLVTLGSPIASLYVRFLGVSYVAFDPNRQLAWLNVFRDDDYIAGEIKGAENRQIVAGGHTYYFCDRRVAQEFSSLARR